MTLGRIGIGAACVVEAVYGFAEEWVWIWRSYECAPQGENDES